MNLRNDDEYIWKAEYKKIPENRLNIPGLHVIGYSTFNKAWEELETHYHNCMELVVVINGSQRYTVDGEQYLLYGGKMFTTQPNEVHGNGNLPQDVCEFVWVQLDLSFEDNFLELSGDSRSILLNSLRKNKDRIIDVDTKDLALIQDAWNGLSAENREKQIWGCSCLVQFLSKYFCVKHRGGPELSPDIQSALAYINKNILGDLSIKAVAKEIGMSESRFKAKFRHQLGITPLVYITSQKMEIAKYMLKRTPQSVTQIAFALNYSSSNYFSSVFRKYTGYTPTTFRETASFKQF